MHFKNQKLAVGLLALTLSAGMIACNGKKDEKKEPAPADTPAVKPAPVMPADTTKLDTADTRPVKTPD